MPVASSGAGGPLGLGILPATGAALEKMLRGLPGAIAAELEPTPSELPALSEYYGTAPEQQPTSWLPWILAGAAALALVVVVSRR